MAGRRFAQAIEQQRQRGGGHRVVGLGDGGQGGDGIGGQGHVVEARDGDVGGDAQAERMRPGQGANGHRVVAAAQGGWAVGEDQQGVRRGVAAGEVEGAFPLPLPVRVDARRPQRRDTAFQALAGMEQAQGTVHEADPPVPQGKEMAHDQRAAGAGVGAHGVAGPGDRDAVERDDRDAVEPVGHTLLRGVGGNEDNAVDALVAQGVQMRHLARQIVLGVAEEQAIAALCRLALQAARQLGEEQVRAIRHHQAEHVRLARAQAAGDVVRVVAELRDGGEHALPRRRGDRARAAVHDVRHGRRGDAGAGGHVVARDAAEARRGRPRRRPFHGALRIGTLPGGDGQLARR